MKIWEREDWAYLGEGNFRYKDHEMGGWFVCWLNSEEGSVLEWSEQNQKHRQIRPGGKGSKNIKAFRTLLWVRWDPMMARARRRDLHWLALKGSLWLLVRMVLGRQRQMERNRLEGCCNNTWFRWERKLAWTRAVAKEVGEKHLDSGWMEGRANRTC